MSGYNRAEKDYIIQKSFSILESFAERNRNCVFISYQRKDEAFAFDVASYIMEHNLDVYFDLHDNDLKFKSQIDDPSGVTTAIRRGLNQSNYMIVIVSASTFRSLWVPFEIGYAYDDMEDNLKVLKRKDIEDSALPGYLKTKDILWGVVSLDNFLRQIQPTENILENRIEKSQRAFSQYDTNPLRKYLANE